MAADRQGELFAQRRALSEREWQTVLQDGLKRTGWRWQHVFRLQTKDGAWRTSTTASGWPDLVALRPGWVLAIECKAASGKVDPDQLAWLRSFQDAGALAWVLRPTDSWRLVGRWLQHPGEAPDRWGW